MNTIETNNMTVAVESANNSETSAPVLATPTAKVGRPRTNLTKEVVFVHNPDGSIVRRGKGKPAHNSVAMVYSVPWDYKGTALPESVMFLRIAEVKDTRKPKSEAANPVVPSPSDMLPPLIG